MTAKGTKFGMGLSNSKFGCEGQVSINFWPYGQFKHMVEMR